MLAKAGKKESQNAMDYPEHDRTYEMFLNVTKWVTVYTVALLIAMAAGFFAGFGLFGGIVVFIILALIAYFFA